MKKTVLFLAIALIGAAVLSQSMKQGPGVGGDATIYMSSALHLLQGRGLGLIGPQGEFRLLPYFPPFYSLVLALFRLVGMPLPFAGYWINLICFGGLVFLVGHETERAARSLILGGLAGLLVALSPVLIPVYSWAMSEPLAILLGFGGLALLVGLPDDAKPLRRLVLAGLVSGLALITRYINVATVLTGGLLIWIYLAGSLRKKIQSLFIYGLVSAVPMLIWLLVDLSQTATVSSRRVETAAGMLARLGSFFPALKDVYLFWFIPDSWVQSPPYPAAANLLLLVAAALVLAAVGTGIVVRLPRRNSAQTDALSRWAVTLTIYSGVYLLVVAAVYLTTYPPITIASRMFSPAHVAFVWLLPLLAALAVKAWPGLNWLKLALPAALLVFLALYGYRSLRIVQQNFNQGLGFNSMYWQASDTIQALEQIPDDQLIVTNEEMAVLFLTGRAAYPLMEPYQDTPLTSFSRYGDGEVSKDRAQRLFKDGEAQLVLFDTIHGQLEGLYGEQTAERVSHLTGGLSIIYQGQDGSIYRYP